MPNPLFIPVILGTTRKGRRSENAARFVFEETKKRAGVETEFVDICEIPMRLDDAGEQIKDQAFSDLVKRADGLILVVPEYNHGYPGLLKHALDTAWYLMGSPRPTSISAKVFRNFAHLVNVPVFDVEDEAHAFIHFANDAIVELETCWAANLTDDTPAGPEWVGRESNNCVLFGTRGTLRLKPLTLFEDDNGKLASVPLEPRYSENSFEMQLRNFAAAIRGQTPAINNAEQAFELMNMIDGIYASSELRREVPVA